MADLIVDPTEDSTPFRLFLMDTGGWWRFTVRGGGCVDIRRYFNTPYPENDGSDDDPDNYMDDLHVCDLDGFIEMLGCVREKAKAHFPVWPG